jgi:hypothetical protein
MNLEQHAVDTLRGLWGKDPDEPGEADYQLLAQIPGAYVARARSGFPALVVPINELGAVPVGRRASGCELVAHSSTQLVFEGRITVGPAAALLCINPELVDVFAVLAVDVAKRAQDGGSTWACLLAAVEEWQTLLTPRRHPSLEEEIGLWGELWFLSQSDDIERTLYGWRGPEGDSTDFFLGGKGTEVKTTRKRHQHHMSLSQVDAPVGAHEAWLLSIWVKLDPVSSNTVVQLAEGILERAHDRGSALRRMAQAGFSPMDRGAYTGSYVVLAEPEWYAATEVPRVRSVDPGISHLRYRVSLADVRTAERQTSDSLWRHFHGHDYKGARK